jgi:nicotinamide riboside transporter PnuC
MFSYGGEWILVFLTTYGGLAALYFLVKKNKIGFVIGAIISGWSLMSNFSGGYYGWGIHSTLINLGLLALNIWGYFQWQKSDPTPPHKML